MTNQNYSLAEIENMVPWERDIYVTLLLQHIEEENERRRQKAAKEKK